MSTPYCLKKMHYLMDKQDLYSGFPGKSRKQSNNKKCSPKEITNFPLCILFCSPKRDLKAPTITTVKPDAQKTCAGHNSSTAVSHKESPVDSNGDPQQQLAQHQILLHVCKEICSAQASRCLGQACKWLLLGHNVMSPEMSSMFQKLLWQFATDTG